MNFRKNCRGTTCDSLTPFENVWVIILVKIKIYLIKNTMSCTMSGRNDEIWRYNSCTTNHVSPIFCMMHCCCPRPYYFQVLIFIFSNFRKTHLNKFYATVTFSILFWPPMICCWDCISLLPVKNAKHAGRAKSLISFKNFYILKFPFYIDHLA